jgi:3-hydroxyacyl-CoA dehydrogenase
MVRFAAVLGAGTMGAQIAAHLANAGVSVLLLDLTREAAVDGLKRARGLKPDPFFTADTVSRIETGGFETDLARLGDADWIVEAIVEQLDVKRALLARVDAVRRPDAIVSSNTSGIPIGALAEGRSDSFRHHWLGTHFFNPPRYLKLVELIPTLDTDPAVTAALAAFIDKHLGKGVVIAKDTPNFIANRIGLFGVLRILDELAAGRYTIEEIDAITGPALGRPKSATFRTLDITGLDIVLHVTRNLRERLGEATTTDFRVPALVEDMAARGWIGEKGGQGFYRREPASRGVAVSAAPAPGATAPSARDTTSGSTTALPAARAAAADTGGSTILTLDIATMTYRARQSPKLASIDATKSIEDVGARIRTLFLGKDRVGEFLRATLGPTLLYAAQVAPDIAHSIDDVDRAMCWGFGWELGPFETMDAIGLRELLDACGVSADHAPALIAERLGAGAGTAKTADAATNVGTVANAGAAANVGTVANSGATTSVGAVVSAGAAADANSAPNDGAAADAGPAASVTAHAGGGANTFRSGRRVAPLPGMLFLRDGGRGASAGGSDGLLSSHAAIESTASIKLFTPLKPLKKNAGGSLIDLGDGVLALELHSKLNLIGGDTMAMITAGVKEAERNFAAFVIATDAANFSAGANLVLLLLEAQEGNWDEVDLMVRTFQNANLALRYAAVPVVMAPAGLALGGGCEMALHADRLQAASETYIGLVETGVGLIPAGGGTKEMVARGVEALGTDAISADGRRVQVDLLPAMQRVFETLGLAKASTSAAHARQLGYLRDCDRITMNRDRLVADAKALALTRVAEGYQPPPRRMAIPVGGEPLEAALKLGLHLMHRAGRISDHDALVGRALAHIIAGGTLPHATIVSEQHLLDLEREAFLKLCGQRKTLERIQFTLKTGKPLRN